MLRLTSFASLGLVLCVSAAAHATDYDESVNGDLSNNRLSPTHITLTPGSNTITDTQVNANSPTGDLDYYRITVPTGSSLTAINVISTTTTSLAFIAIQRGLTFSEPNTGTNVANLLGYTHFGPGNGTVGMNILTNLGTGAGAQDFVPPLPSGDYVFWQQETSSVPTTSKLNFVVSAPPQSVPLPRAAIGAMAVGLALVGAGLARRRRAGA